MTDKAQLRRETLAKRDALSERKEKSGIIKNRLFALDEIKNAKCIAFYITKGSEVDTRSMMDEAINKGKTVLVPHTEEEIKLVKFTSWNDLKPGKFGILEPRTKIKRQKSPDVVIVPGVAFDLQGYRIGYGKGYYDRLLKKLKAKRIGICFDIQIIEKIPKHGHDERLDSVITEKRMVK